MLACCAVAAAVVAVDAYFSAQEGYLSRAPDYDGVSYLGTSRSVYFLLHALHFRTALSELNSSLAPLWIAALAFQQLIFGDGTWQAFTARFWGVAPLLTLVYWIVRTRSSRPLAVAAVGFTAVLPVVSAAVRASSREFITGQANYGEFFSMEDLRPDFFAIVMVLCSVVPLAEHYRAPRRSTYVVSAVFAAASVLAKPSTAPFSLLAWGLAVGAVWLWHRRAASITRLSALGVAVLALLLAPWAIKGGVSETVSRYYEIAVTYHATYNLGLGLLDSVTYYLVRLATQLGQIEVWFVIVGSVLLAFALLRRWLEFSEWMYAGLFVLFYSSFTILANKNSLVGFWVTLPLWIFFVAGASRLLGTRWATGVTRASPFVLAGTAAYMVVIYALGAFALANWPVDEQRSNAQLLTVTTQLADAMRPYVSSNQCFAYAPGPGWPASIEYLMTDSSGKAPGSTPVDIDPSISVNDYVRYATSCPAAIVYREDISVVAQQFIAYPVRQPYLRAVAEWVRSPISGYTLDRSWQFTDLASNGPHTLGRYEGLTLTVDLYVRKPSG
ncbi:MAG: hypothetical protein E6I05_03660 [Chloroflexi bacterium]|nr:MAG: hypothetical protein E6I05_03660 [Chloroflexota bacterium]